MTLAILYIAQHKTVQQHFQFLHIAHVTLHFYQVPLYPLHRSQQDCYELGSRFPKCFGDFAGFIRTSMIIFLLDDLLYNIVNVHFS